MFLFQYYTWLLYKTNIYIIDLDSLVSISLYLFWKNVEIESFFNFWSTIDQILGVINETDSVSYVTVLGFLLYNSLLSLR